MVSGCAHRQEELELHYNNLYESSVARIKNGDYETDEMLQHPEEDKRLGITLIARIKNAPKEAIESFLLKAQQIEPNQYYYVNNDLHITIMPLITSHNDFNIQDVRLEDYVQLIQESISNMPSFKIVFKGVTASPSCVMIKGFLGDDTLDRIRNNLRQTFRNSKMKNTLDDRYSLTTAHSTAIRFKDQLRDTDTLLDLLESSKDTFFGTLEVESLELTCNNWYHSISNTLHKFDLNNK